MNDAWEQIGDVLAANSKMRQLQMAMQVASRWHTQSLMPLAAANAERALMLTGPVARRVLSSGTTVAAGGKSQPGSTRLYLYGDAPSGAAPGRFMRSLPFTAAITPNNLLARVNSGAVSAAPPKVAPPDAPTVNQAAGAAAPQRRAFMGAKLAGEISLAALRRVGGCHCFGRDAGTGRPCGRYCFALAIAAAGDWLVCVAEEMGGGRSACAGHHGAGPNSGRSRATAQEPDLRAQRSRQHVPAADGRQPTAPPRPISRRHCGIRSRCSRRHKRFPNGLPRWRSIWRSLPTAWCKRSIHW